MAPCGFEYAISACDVSVLLLELGNFGKLVANLMNLLASLFRTDETAGTILRVVHGLVQSLLDVSLNGNLHVFDGIVMVALLLEHVLR